MKSFSKWTEDRQDEQPSSQIGYAPARTTEELLGKKTPDGGKFLGRTDIKDVISHLNDNGLEYWALMVQRLEDRKNSLERSTHEFMNKYYELQRKINPPFEPMTHKSDD